MYLTEILESKLNGTYTLLRAALNQSRRQHPTKQQLYGPIPPIPPITSILRKNSSVTSCYGLHGKSRVGRPQPLLTFTNFVNIHIASYLPEDLPALIQERDEWRDRQMSESGDDDMTITMIISLYQMKISKRF